MNEPLHDLQRVFELIKEQKVWFSAKSRSVYAVQKAYELTKQSKSLAEAEEFILKAIQALTKEHFCKRVIQWNDSNCVADVYGLIFDEKPWYVKFMIGADDDDGEYLDEISFHPPEKEFETVGGIKIPEGDHK